LKRLVAYLGLILLAAFYGLVASVLPLQLIAIPVLPIVILVALIVSVRAQPRCDNSGRRRMRADGLLLESRRSLTSVEHRGYPP